MKILDPVHHIAVIVTDVDRAKRFYGEVLGLPEVARPDFPFGGAWYDIGGRQVHLIVHEEAKTVRGTRAIDPKDGHFAMRVESYKDAVAHLERHGVEHFAQPYNKTPWAQIYFTDPDGNIIELNADRSTI